jgi:hypothetical protein
MHKLKLHFFKKQFSKTLECLYPVSPYMFRSLKLTILRGECSFALLLVCLVVVPRHNFTRACGFVCSVYAVVCALPLLVQLCLCLCLCCCVCSPAAGAVAEHTQQHKQRKSHMLEYTTGRAVGEHTQQHKQRQSHMPG